VVYHKGNVRVAVVPAYEEERTIGSIVLQTNPHVDQTIIVDDGSQDDTAAVARYAGATVIELTENRGQGTAPGRGFKAAMEMGADIIITLDGDGQHDPDSIPDLVKPIENNEASFVVGVRSQAGDGDVSAQRRFGRSVLDSVTNLAAGTELQDTQSGYRAFDAEILPPLLPEENGLGVESEMLIRADGMGSSVAEVPIREHYPEEATPSQHPLRQATSIFRTVLRITRGEYPLLFFGSISTGLLLLGLLYGYDTATHYYQTREFWPGKAMLAMLCALLGSQFAIGGMILDYLSLQFED